MITLEINGVEISVGSWAGPKNLLAHCVSEVYASGNVKSACGKRFAVANLAPEEGTRRHIKRCDICVSRTGAKKVAVDDVPMDVAPATPDVPTAAPALEVSIPRSEAIASEKERRAAAVCKGVGLPPVPGSRVSRDTGESLPDTFEGTHSAACPECGRIIAVNRKGVMRRHNAPKAEVSAESLAEDDVLDSEAAIQRRGIEEATAVAQQKSLTRRRSAEEISQAARAPREAREIARETDSRCSLALKTPEGEIVLRPINGRSHISPVEGTIGPAPGVGNGQEGKCPNCRQMAPITEKGFIATHRAVKPSGPPLTQKSVPVVENGTPVADEARRQNAAAYVCLDEAGNEVPAANVSKRRKKGEVITRTPVIEHAENAAGTDANGVATIGGGNRDQGTIDGAAFTPGNLPPVQPKGKGWSARAGTNSLPVGTLKKDVVVISGDLHGNCLCGKGRNAFAYLTCAEYRALSDSQQRQYWRNLAVMAKRAKVQRAKARKRMERQRPSAAERKAARKAASVGKGALGTPGRPVTD